MRALLLLLFLANLVLAGVAVWIGPAEIATHFTAGGEPDGWMSSGANAAWMCGISVLLFVLFYGVADLMHVLPVRWVNLPHREYWLHPDRIDETRAALARQLARIGAATFLLMLVTGVLALQANLAEPVRLREDLVWTALGLYGAYTLYWCVRFTLAFRVPTP